MDKEAQSITPVEITPGNKFTATYETDENVDAGSNTRNNLIEAASVILTNSEATEMAIKGELAPALNTALTAAEQNGLIKVDGATWVVAGGNDNQVLDKPGPSKDDQRGNQQVDREDEKNDGTASQRASHNESISQSNLAGPTNANLQSDSEGTLDLRRQ